MIRQDLVGKLVGRGKAAEQVCVKLSSTRFIARTEWVKLKPHEQQFLRCWAAGAAAHTSILVGRAAATAHGMWVLPRTFEVEMANPKGRVPRHSQRPSGVTYRRIVVPGMDITALGQNDEVKLTTPVRTAVDIARWHGVKEGVVAMDSLFFGKLDAFKGGIHTELEETIHRLSGNRGIEQAREAFRQLSMLSESPYETLVRLLLRRVGVVAQEQMRIGNYRVDLLWGQLIIEVDGSVKFEQDAARAAQQHIRRENQLREAGYWIIRITPTEVWANEEKVLRRIVEAKRRSEKIGPASVEALPAW
ncbi:endonuclease domain-containing protein [Corynebacterium sp. HMSC034B08]|uniref:endonuclease domain-containing protein n=1 Tax=Corynebacterium sp. HMSC034B08 TaxID=1715135 RepID=UPI00143B9E75|nr:DUF559 domain-containing protein [Corynebacterium sp. HMSC034B08]